MGFSHQGQWNKFIRKYVSKVIDRLIKEDEARNIPIDRPAFIIALLYGRLICLLTLNHLRGSKGGLLNISHFQITPLRH